MTGTSSIRRIGLIVDHPSRDLPGMELLALELARRGIETALIPLYDQGMDVPLLGLDALVLNFARPTNEAMAHEYARFGIPLYVLDTEGGILSDTGRGSPEAIAAYIGDSGFAKLLQGYFFWGEALRDAFRAADVMPAERMHVTGCPRFDYYTPRWAELEPPKRRGHILINTNFPVVNPRFASAEAGDVAALRSIGMTDDYIARLQLENRRVMEGMIALVDQLARDLPDRQFVLRPHPFERQEVYESAFAGLANVIVDGSGPVREALLGAHALVHCNCGTAVEALMMGLAPLTPEWLNSDFLRAHASLPSRASRPVEGYAEMRALIASPDPAAGFDMGGRYDATSYRYFHHNDGEAAARVADILAGACRGGARRNRSLRMSLRGSHGRPRPAQRLQGIAANLLGSAAVRALRARLRPARGQKHFGPDRVRRDIGRLAGFRALSAPEVRSARHPLSGRSLSTVIVTSVGAETSQ